MNCAVPNCNQQCWNHYATCFRHTPVSRETLYRVWRAITNDPSLSIRKIAPIAGRSVPTTQRALHRLVEMGAITHQERQARAWTVIEPFNWVRWP